MAVEAVHPEIKWENNIIVKDVTFIAWLTSIDYILFNDKSISYSLLVLNKIFSIKCSVVNIEWIISESLSFKLSKVICFDVSLPVCKILSFYDFFWIGILYSHLFSPPASHKKVFVGKIMLKDTVFIICH